MQSADAIFFIDHGGGYVVGAAQLRVALQELFQRNAPLIGGSGLPVRS